MKCKLCQQNNKLLRSHIIPEFFYKDTYSKSHKISVVSTGKIPKEFMNLQKGLRERLLCIDCEQLISPWEKYVREALFGGVELQIAADKHFIKIMDVDYHRFKLFSLSLIWRASISANLFFKHVNLGPQEDKIRRMLLIEDPGNENNYSVMLSAVSLSNAAIKDLVMQPEILSERGIQYLRFFLGSFCWLFVLSENCSSFPLHEYFLKQDGSMLIPKGKANELELFLEFSSRVITQGRIIDHTEV